MDYRKLAGKPGTSIEFIDNAHKPARRITGSWLWLQDAEQRRGTGTFARSTGASSLFTVFPMDTKPPAHRQTQGLTVGVWWGFGHQRYIMALIRKMAPATKYARRSGLTLTYKGRTPPCDFEILPPLSRVVLN